jgi:hypothetical protein
MREGGYADDKAQRSTSTGIWQKEGREREGTNQKEELATTKKIKRKGKRDRGEAKARS